VTKLDRLARSVPDALDILSGLSARGVRFALGGSTYDWNDPFARMFLQILAVIAEFEANLIRQRTREGMDIAPTTRCGTTRRRGSSLACCRWPFWPRHRSCCNGSRCAGCRAPSAGGRTATGSTTSPN
jgi:Resolvase, N terminal domain